jgi:hypothetical protein
MRKIIYSLFYINSCLIAIGTYKRWMKGEVEVLGSEELTGTVHDRLLIAAMSLK